MNFNIHLRLLTAAFICLSGVAMAQSASQRYLAEALKIKSSNTERSFELLKLAAQTSEQEKQWNVFVSSLIQMALLENKLSSQQCEEVLTFLSTSFKNIGSFDDGNELANLHYYTALFYRYYSREADSAIYHYNAALKIRKKSAHASDLQVALCYEGIGDIQKYIKGNFIDAEKSYEKALSIREQIQDNDSEALARIYYSLATTNRSQRDFEKAIVYGLKTVEIVEELRDLNFLERTYTVVANIYRDIDEPRKAKEFYLKAIALNIKTSNSKEVLAWHYLSLAETFKNEALYQDAINYFEKSRRIYESRDLENPQLFAYCLEQLADTHYRNGSYELAIVMNKKALKVLRELKTEKGRQVSQIMTSLGKIFYVEGNIDSSLYYTQQSLITAIDNFNSTDVKSNPQEKDIGLSFYIYQPLMQKASILQQLAVSKRQPELSTIALKGLILAEKLLSQERNTLDAEASKYALLDSNYDLYEQIISSIYRQRATFKPDSASALAFHYFEKSKARTLLDALEQSEKLNASKNEDTLLRHQEELKRRWFEWQDKLEHESHRTDSNHRVTASIRQEMVELDRSIQRNKKRIEETYPGYFRVKYEDVIPSLGTISRYSQETDRPIIEYFFGKNEVYAVGIRGSEISFLRIGSADSVAMRALPLIKRLSTKNVSLSKVKFQSFIENANSLYETLVKPFASMLEDNDHLLIIPDGILSQIPFEVLLFERPKAGEINYLALPYLIKHYTISYTYAIASLSKPRDVVKHPDLLAIGFTGGSVTRGSSQGLTELEGTEFELESLFKRFGSGRFLKGMDATESNFKQLAPKYNILHLAIHGQGDLERNFDSKLFFKNVSGSPDDGELHAYELYGLKLNAQLVVLSACETGLGKFYRGEGMMSIANAFTYAGCESVLMSLWKVNDKSSILLMDDFYDNIQEGRSIDDALTDAKLKYLKDADELTADPAFWAPLVSYGNQAPVFYKSKSRIFIILMVSIISIPLFIFILLKRRKRHATS
jgi:CHAT domain-containing protein/tetratricopeptide (TPR) repeat protein